MNFDLGLEKRGVEIMAGLPPPRVEFNGWIEDWESDAIKSKASLHEFKLLEKYKGVPFFDEEDGVTYKILHTNLEWSKKVKGDAETPCYCVLAVPESEDGTFDLFDVDTDELIAYRINFSLHAMIRAHAEQAGDDGLAIVESPEAVEDMLARRPGDDDDDDDDEEEEEDEEEEDDDGEEEEEDDDDA